ncbi:MAG: TetR/AcrR family transcriptional regulator [Kofleriaceae bacterium]|nr:TetR/AcrR family transcriptional regulator [Kofleriaceae bacterium]
MARQRRRIRAERRVERVERRAARLKPERRRRSPEVARQEILAAAERLFTKHGPEEVGLKDIGREAGVSHALITHYFGTYVGLCESVLQRRLMAVREIATARLREAGVLSRPDELLAILFRTLEDPVHLRLMKWLMANEKEESAMNAFALQEQGIQAIAMQVAGALTPQPSKPLVDTLSLALVTAVAAAIGYSLTKHALAGAIGREPSPELDAGVRGTLAGMLQAYLRETIGLR